jgi:hypothetical protein
MVSLTLVAAVAAFAAPVPFGNHSYDLILDNEASWPDAEADAASIGGRLATITSAAEQAFIKSLLINRAAPTGAYWFGLEEIDDESNVFVPLNDETSSYNNFGVGEPNNGITIPETVGSIFWTADAAGPGFARRGQWNDLPLDGYPDPDFITDEADLYRAGYLVEFGGDQSGGGNGDGDGTGGGNEDGTGGPTVGGTSGGGNGTGGGNGNGGGNGTGGGNGGANPIPLPPAALAFPLTALIAFAAIRRMRHV